MTDADIRPLLEKKVPEDAKDWDTMLRISTAISLRRIADALDDGLTSLLPDGSVAGAADVLEGIRQELERRNGQG